MRVRLERLSAAVLVIAAVMGCKSGASGGSARDSADTRAAPGSAASTVVRADSIALKTDKTQYQAGEAMTLTFENTSGRRYTFNPCTRTIERESGGTWTALPDEGRMCTMQAFILAPRSAQTGQTELPSPLAPGRYRVVVRMTPDDPGANTQAGVHAVSDPFTVS